MAEAQQNPQPSLSTIGVLRESFKTTRRNGKLAASILLLVLWYSLPLKFGTMLLTTSIKKQVTSDRKSSSFEARSDAGSFQWADQGTIMQSGVGRRVPSTQWNNPSSYSYMGRSTPKGEVRGIHTSQRANPSSYGYMDQHVLRSSQPPKSGSYRYTGQSSAIGKVRGIRSSQSPNHGSYGYEDYSMRMRGDGGTRSSQQSNPSTYSYMGRSTPIGEIRGIRYSQRANPGSYGYMDQHVLRSSQQPKSGSYGYTGQSSVIGEVRGIRSSQSPNHSSYSYEDYSMPMRGVGGTRSSLQSNPGSYGYMDQFMPIGEFKAIRPILKLKLLALAAFWVMLLCFLISTVSSSYEAHTGKVMNLRDVFLKVRESWKRPILTSFCLTLISFGLFFLLSLFVGLIQIFAEGSTAYILYAILAVSSFLTYLHMAARWMLSLVVSVLESDSSGLKAIDRAGELMKGKRIQAFVLIILFHLALGAIQMMSNALTKKHDGWVKMAITIPFTLGLVNIVKFLMFTVFTVYYHDRKMSRKEEGVKGQLVLYVPLASDEV